MTLLRADRRVPVAGVPHRSQIARIAIASGVSAVAAGYIFIVSTGVMRIVDALASGRAPFGYEMAALAGALLFGWIAIPFGFVLAIVPCLVGTAVLTVLGQRLSLVRHPFVWAATGGLAIVIPAGAQLFAPDGRPVVGMMIAGIGCALVSRALIRWPAG